MRQVMRRLVMLAGIVLAGVALLDQLGRRPEDRDWNGRVLNVPYDLRVPTLERVRQRLWNPDDERLLTPVVFGMGWTVNLYQLVRRAGLLIA
jgi:hypothetical protein